MFRYEYKRKKNILGTKMEYMGDLTEERMNSMTSAREHVCIITFIDLYLFIYHGEEDIHRSKLQEYIYF